MREPVLGYGDHTLRGVDMTTIAFDQVNLQFGFKLSGTFTNQGFFAPWPGNFCHVRVIFNPPFLDDDDVRVFLTPTNEKLNADTQPHAAVVGVAHRVNREGFELWARSTDCADG